MSSEDRYYLRRTNAIVQIFIKLFLYQLIFILLHCIKIDEKKY